MSGPWTPEPFEADDGSVPFGRFVDDLSDFKFVALDTAIHRVLAIRGIDLVRTLTSCRACPGSGRSSIKRYAMLSGVVDD